MTPDPMTETMRFVPLPDHIGLAREVLAMLKTQREYFDTRNIEKLRAAKSWEKRLREKCEAILKGAQPSLFEEGGAA